MQIKMFKEVFISHAKEDFKVAEQIYVYLEQRGYSPWLDKKKLKVGANWDYEIKKALKESTFVILLLSSTSVKKRGYVQKEFRYAIEYSENKLIDDIYIIPILLDKCEVPDPLNKFQWVKIDAENLMDEILNSLDSQRQKYLNSLSPELIQASDYTSLSINLNIDLPLNIEYKCDLPLFRQNKYFEAYFVNVFIQQRALLQISQFRKLIIEYSDFLKDRENLYVEISHTIKRLDEKYLSLAIVYNSYLGGAHPNTSINTLNFAFCPDRVLEFRDLVKCADINQLISNWLLKYGSQEQKECLSYYIQYLTEDNIGYTFDKEMLEVDFTNQIPRVILAIGTLEIPMKEIANLE